MRTMKIPVLDLKAQFQSIKDEVHEKVIEVLSSQNFVLGSEVEALEREIAVLSGAEFGIGVSSGTDALIITLMALGIGEGDSVITTPFTFFATAGAIARIGASPIFCDIEEQSYNIDPGQLDSLFKPQSIKRRKKTSVKAIIPVHLYGQCADMDPIMKLAERTGIIVIEDAAQAIGAEYPSAEGTRKAGAIGHAGALSFYPSKNLGGFGDGGMVLTNDGALAQKLKCLRVHGEEEKYIYSHIGGNFRLDALQAAILRVKLRHLESWQRTRQEKARVYDTKFIESGLVHQKLVKIPMPVFRERGISLYHTYHQYVIRIKERDRLQAHLRERGIGTSIFYPLPLHLQQCFSYIGHKKGDFPVSERVSREVLALPIYPELSEEKQDCVVSCISEFYAKL